VLIFQRANDIVRHPKLTPLGAFGPPSILLAPLYFSVARLPLPWHSAFCNFNCFWLTLLRIANCGGGYSSLHPHHRYHMAVLTPLSSCQQVIDGKTFGNFFLARFFVYILIAPRGGIWTVGGAKTSAELLFCQRNGACHLLSILAFHRCFQLKLFCSF